MSERPSRWKSLPFWMTVATAATAGVALAVPASRGFILTASGYLVELDIPGLRDYLRTFGDRAWLVSGLLMILQSLAAPIPALPITLANALVYGVWTGALLSWGSAQVAALLCFFLGRGLGRPFVERLFSRTALDRFDHFFKAYGTLSILVARLVPVVSFDIVSYGAGLTGMRPMAFIMATGLGQLPACIVYSYAGADLATSPSRAGMTVLWFIGGVAVLFGIVVFFRRRSASKRS